MKEVRTKDDGVHIRRGTSSDVEFVRVVAEQVFAQFGDYGHILPSWLVHEGVLTHVAVVDGAAAGYTMLGFYPVPRGGSFVADLLAIAVAPGSQGRGVGKKMLEHVLAQVKVVQRRLAVKELRLSVADTNVRARKLFDAFGFELIEGEHGFYDGGQRALHMTLEL